MHAAAEGKREPTKVLLAHKAEIDSQNKVSLGDQGERRGLPGCGMFVFGFLLYVSGIFCG